WKIANRVDASVILVNNGPNEWYQGGIDGLGETREQVTDTFRAWAAHLNASRLYTVGTSMGGTGALLHGAALGARVLAFAAETRMDWPWSNVRRLMVKGFTPPVMDLRPVLERATAPIYLYVGECEPVDLVSAKHVADLEYVFAESMPRVTHGPPNYLKNRGLLDPLVDGFLDDAHLPRMPEGGRGLVGGFATKLYEAYCADREKRFKDAVRAASAATRSYPRSEYANYLLGKGLLHLKHYAKAEAALSEAVRLHPGLWPARLSLATAIEKQDRAVEAVALYKKMADNVIVGGRANYALGQVYLSKGSMASALQRFRKAVAMDPHRAAFQAKLDQVEADYAAR
ncbi:MAG: tetratricopeptide repeat protein, partial [Brevundimonas sp.]